MNTIRQIETKDCSDLAVIHTACFQKNWDSAEFEKLIAGEANSGWLLSQENTIIAFVILMESGDDIEILTIATHPDFQRQGLSQRLLKNCDMHFCSQQAIVKRHRWLLEVAIDNYPAIAFYKKLGFSQIGIRKKYYAKSKGVFVDALVLTQKIGEIEG